MKCYLSIQIKQKVTLRKGKARLEGTNPCDTPVHLLINKFEIRRIRSPALTNVVCIIKRKKNFSISNKTHKKKGQ